MGIHVCFDEFREGRFPSGLFGLICQHSHPFSICILVDEGVGVTQARNRMKPKIEGTCIVIHVIVLSYLKTKVKHTEI